MIIVDSPSAGFDKNANKLSEHKTASRLKSPASMMLIALILLISSWSSSNFIGAADGTDFATVCFRLILFASAFTAWYLQFDVMRCLRRREWLMLMLLSSALSVVIILGGHVSLTSGYSGTIDQNTILPYGKRDIVSFFLQLPALLAVCTGAYCVIVHPHTHALRQRTATTSTLKKKLNAGMFLSAQPISRMLVIVSSALMLLCWLPYLLAYWPGYIFGDSLGQIGQALGQVPLSNHHPIAHTLLIRFCLDIGNFLFASNTVGCAIYSLLQMCIMALCLSYASIWTTVRLRIPKAVGTVLIAVFALTPYIANYSIALWKDPLFSCALLILALCLGNFLIGLETSFRLIHPKPWSIAACALATILLRNNGLYVCIAVLIALLAVIVHVRRNARTITTRRNGSKQENSSRHSPFYKRTRCNSSVNSLTRQMLVLFTAALVLGYTITGPVYTSIGANSDAKVESEGIMLNQMARVVALDGDMSASDKSYMAELLPIDEYRNVYAPCLIDNLKWNPQFNAQALDSRIYSHYVSMGLRNPIVYFQAWELETAGFWTLSMRSDDFYMGNIGSGVPRNLNTQYGVPEEFNISTKSKLPENIQSFLPSDEWSIPAGWVLWLMVFTCICLIGGKKARWILLIIPGAAILATLAVASPIVYWARYALTVQLTLPVYIGLLWRLRQARININESGKE